VSAARSPHASARSARRLALGLLLLAFGAPRRARTQPLDSATAARVDAVFARHTATTPGCALDVRRGGTSVHARGYGLASLELGVPISPRTVFDLGSTSKQFTAASVALLALDGRLSLDDDVRKHVPELPDLGATVTLRHLLTHTSGWRDYIDLMMLEGWDDRDHTTDREALAALVRQRALNFPPGTDFRYSNTGYFLMSLVVERVAGRPLAQFARQRIFEPLGMRDTRYLTDAREVIPHKATAYQPQGAGKWVIAMSDWEQVGDGGVQTTMADLARWDANLTSGAVGGRPLLDLLTTTARLRDGTPLTYALGLTVDEYHGLRRVHHGGAWAGYRTMLMRFPSERLSLLLSCNVADANVMRLATGVADVLLPPTVAAAPPAGPLAARPIARPAGGDLARLAGTYFDPGVGQLVRVAVEDGALVVPGTRPVTLLDLGGARYRQPVTGAEWHFDESAGGRRLVVRTGTAQPTVYDRVEPTADAARPTEYVGTYASDEAAAEWVVAVRDGALVLQGRRGPAVTLRPLFRDAFSADAVLRFERDAAGRVVALTATSRGVQALRFARR
jgi:CubicO group peptidase (beta-lactamase class C family)